LMGVSAPRRALNVIPFLFAPCHTPSKIFACRCKTSAFE
jgi:hypothetical protein